MPVEVKTPSSHLALIGGISQRLRITNHTGSKHNLSVVKVAGKSSWERFSQHNKTNSIAQTILLFTSPVILSWLPKLRPVKLDPSSKWSTANAEGGFWSSPLWVAINRFPRLLAPIDPVGLTLDILLRKAVPRRVLLPLRAKGRNVSNDAIFVFFASLEYGRVIN